MASAVACVWGVTAVTAVEASEDDDAWMAVVVVFEAGEPAEVVDEETYATHWCKSQSFVTYLSTLQFCCFGLGPVSRR